MPSVTGPDGRKLSFPEGTDPQVVMQVLREQYPDANWGQPAKQQMPQPEPVDMAAVARQTFDESPWYAKPFIAAGGELTRIGRGVQQLVTPDDSEYGRALQGRIDADAPMQDGIHGVSGFVGRALPYLATLPLGGPEAALLGRAAFHRRRRMTTPALNLLLYRR